MGSSWPLPGRRASNRVSTWQDDGYGRVAKAALDAAECGSFGGCCRLRSPASGAWLSIGPGDCGAQRKHARHVAHQTEHTVLSVKRPNSRQ